MHFSEKVDKVPVKKKSKHYSSAHQRGATAPVCRIEGAGNGSKMDILKEKMDFQCSTKYNYRAEYKEIPYM